jgi:CRISPR-associated Cas5-like protein
MECFHPCNTTNCTACILYDEMCAWCPVEQQCIESRGSERCKYANESAQGVHTCTYPVLTPAAIVGLSAGVIAAIVIAVAVVLAVAAGVGGRMIYVRYRKVDSPHDIVQNNPVYEAQTFEAQNPIYKTDLPNP